ncbi:Uncharacterized protein T4D_33 [Trichinella pseudospiralis]|uniref:CC domain-containing protein n=1 Tax=Trichinella pseudospiralis TaxID=6337 RepID=A0A0V1FH30_TRIPS|nr:Uncharacterized protein T4D_33 [Trichinella pseudospiralis]
MLITATAMNTAWPNRATVFLFWFSVGIVQHILFTDGSERNETVNSENQIESIGKTLTNWSITSAKLARRQQLRIILGQCSNGNQVVAACFPNYKCGSGYWCDTSINRCCKPKLLNINIHFVSPVTGLPYGIWKPTIPPSSLFCRDGSPAVSRCHLNSACPVGFICTIDKLCCRSGTAASCNFEAEPVALCDRGMCGPNHYCSRDGYCCPTTYGGNVCPNGATPIGLCEQGLCPIGYECISGQICCPEQPHIDNWQTSVCPNNREPVGECINGLCPADMMCINEVCCPISDIMKLLHQKKRNLLYGKKS